MKGIKVIIAGAAAILILSILSQKLLFPTDILNYLQAFNFNSTKSVHNSLLADPIFQFEPWRIFAKTTILRGELPLWNPFNAGGAPFLANPQTAIFYPLNFIYYVLPATLALNLITYFKLSLYAYFTYLFLKSIKISTSSSLIGSIIASCSAFPMMWILWPHTNVFILFPFLLFLTEKLKEGNDGYKYLLSITYLFGVLGGHPETLFHVGILHACYSLFSLKKQKGLLLTEFGYILLGFLLAAFMLIPFFEYVLYSDLLTVRIHGAVGTFLPLAGSVYGLFPFMLGAPNLNYYKVPFPQTNFQELAGGYVGTAILIVTVIGAFRFRKLPIVKYLSILMLILLGVVYKIWPVWLIVAFPPISAVANQRLVGFVGFFAVVLFSVIIDRWSIKSISKNQQEKLRKIIFIFCLLSVLFIGITLYVLFLVRKHDSDFFLLLFYLLVLFILSTFIYLQCLISTKRKKYIFFLTLTVCIVQNAIFLFYNPLNSQQSYYPQNNLTNQLKKLPSGAILEVGNLTFPPNLNLVYGLTHVQGDDAIGVKTYTGQFKDTFRSTNFWGKVDKINQAQANKMGVDYILSDHNINLESRVLQPKIEKILIPKSAIVIPFVADGKTLEEVRLLTANFNRRNTCIIRLELFEGSRSLLAREAKCQNVKDKMFFTLSLGKVELEKGISYALALSIRNDTQDSIGFWSSETGIPYTELLYSHPNTFKEIWSGNGINLFVNEHNNFVEGFSKYSIIQKEQTKFAVEGEAMNTGIVTVKKTNYPGWNVLLDGKKIIQKNNAFFEIPVSKGKHLIEITYIPYSLIVGAVISFSALLFLILSFVRRLHLEVIFKKARRINNARNISIISLSISFIIYSFSLSFIEKSITFKSTGSINWLNIYHYPKGIDFVSVFSFLAINIFVFSFLIWTKYLIKKK